MIEPQLLEPQLAEPASLVPKVPNAIPVRLLDTQARGHIGRRVLHQQPDGELTEDSVWRWSSAPDRYLDTALRLEVASNPDIRLVDVGRAPGARPQRSSCGISNLRVGHDWSGLWSFRSRALTGWLHTQVVRASEPVSAELPGDLAAVAGRLLRRSRPRASAQRKRTTRKRGIVSPMKSSLYRSLARDLPFYLCHLHRSDEFFRPRSLARVAF